MNDNNYCYVIAILLIIIIVCLAFVRDENRGTEAPEVSPQPIRLLQRTLKDAGYYTGEVDGIPGILTMRAWKKWDRDGHGFKK